MIDLMPFVNNETSFTALIAPPGWGKTRLLIDLFRSVEKRVIYLAPLRAIIDEFSEVLSKEKIKNVNLGKDEKTKLVKTDQFGGNVIVTTPEQLLLTGVIESISADTIVVLDELHLFYLWGESFRPILLETIYEAGSKGAAILGLTATLSNQLWNEISSSFSLNGYQIWKIDLGNRTLKNRPSHTYFYNNNFSIFKTLLIKNLLQTLKHKSNVVLVFVAYRSQVGRLVTYLNGLGIASIGCVGGEVTAFREELSNKTPKCIVTTIALGHGVNLPPIGAIFINHIVADTDFLIQMIGRGGRRGESYDLHFMNGETLSLNERIKGMLKALFYGYFNRILKK